MLFFPENCKFDWTSFKRVFSFQTILSVMFFFMTVSCQREIEVPIPPVDSKIVIDGRMEEGQRPFVIVTRNKAYFGTNLNNVQEMFVHNAVVKVNDGYGTMELNEFCSTSMPDSLLGMISHFTGIDSILLKTFDYCIYSTLSNVMKGINGRTYRLTVSVDGTTYIARSTIPPSVAIDSLWWKRDQDTMGFIYTRMHDPAGPGNAYRWLSQRLGRDPSFKAPFSSVFDDKFIDGQQLDFAYGLYREGDTVAVKLCTIEPQAYEYFRSMEVLVNNEGNPFASPFSVKSNIEPEGKALGIWCGLGSWDDTLVCK